MTSSPRYWIYLLLLFLSSGLYGESVGGTLWVANPCRIRWEVDGGGLFVQLSPFAYGVVQSTPSALYIDEHPTQLSYYGSIRASYGLPCSRRDFPVEVYGRAGFYDVHHRDLLDNSALPYIWEPRIDGNTSGSGPQRLLSAHSALNRSLLSAEAEGGIRQRCCCRNWSFYPGLFLQYQRTQQKDVLKTTASPLPFPPPTSYYMKLAAHTNSDQYGGGLNLHFSRPLFCSCLCLCGTAMISGEWVSSLYHGAQQFQLTQGATVTHISIREKDKAHKFGYSTGGELGVRLFVVRALSVSVLANIRYTNNFPFVNYHKVNAEISRGTPFLDFGSQLTYGGVVNLSLAFKQGRLKIL